MKFSVPAGTQVGVLIVRETVQVKTMEQTACNYRLIDLTPGTYPITMGSDGYWFVARVDGVCAASHFVNRLFSASSVADTSDEVGTPMSYGYQWDYPSFIYGDRHDQPHDRPIQVQLDRTVLPLAENASRTCEGCGRTVKSVGNSLWADVRGEGRLECGPVIGSNFHTVSAL